MTAKPIVPRAQALQDIEEAVDHYLQEGGERVALGFVDMLESTILTIASHPAIGSLRYAYELDIPGLRTRRVRRYPYLVFYLENEDQIDIWRVLRARRDIPAWMQGRGGA
jgi:toxin ParE1/3/4